MLRLRNILLIVVGIWSATILAVYLLPHPFYALRVICIWVSFPITIASFILSLLVFFKGENKSQVLWVLALLIFISLMVFTKGRRWGAVAYFYLNKTSLEKRIAALAPATNSVERQKICAEQCVVLTDEPLRVAFPYWRGFLVWDDIVYDPTGELKTQDLEKLRKVDADFYGAEQLDSNWYVGYFSD